MTRGGVEESAEPAAVLGATGEEIRRAYLADEADTLAILEPLARLEPGRAQRVRDAATGFVTAVREAEPQNGLDAFLREYDLSTEEGVTLMCLAEALLRIPDAETADRLIQDKLRAADWRRHVGRSESVLVNASTWGLMLSGRLIEVAPATDTDAGAMVSRLVARCGEPVIRAALRQAMRILGRQFVMGRTITEAIGRSRADPLRQYRFSFDMLGEAALTRADAERYERAYAAAIEAVAAADGTDRAPKLFAGPGLSVKLSALHPRFEPLQRERVMADLVPCVIRLAGRAREAGLSVTLDAEEAERLELTLEVFEAVRRSTELRGWDGLGLAVQAYQKRALPTVRWLARLATELGCRIPVRLVKGAYWDSEIKLAQERGLAGYPVFTRKAATDVSFLACARVLFDSGDAFFPQFATHNAHTVASILEIAGDRPFEFQRLHGMGEALYSVVLKSRGGRVACRVYAPVGSHDELLPYLVRRLLENGANTSFVNRIADRHAPIESIIADPVDAIAALPDKPHPRIPLPRALYGADRRNSLGVNLHGADERSRLREALDPFRDHVWRAAPYVAGKRLAGTARTLREPADHRRVVGEVVEADEQDVERALATAQGAFADWESVPSTVRADTIERCAELIEAHRAELVALCVREGGRCIADALAEVREAVDYCRYYAQQGRMQLAARQRLPGPTGESNELELRGRGTFVCISPWNFPLAIFSGQVVAALAAGNSVIAKPAGQTPLIAARIVELLHEAGVPGEVLQLLPGPGGRIGTRLVSDARVAGVAFTGSTPTANAINRALAAREGAIATLIAETGGINCMIADSSALPEQVARDVLQSAFNSAGQRCSALRVLLVQADIASHVIELLAGAMAELRIGDPLELDTDVGPVIDANARVSLLQHVERMRREARPIAETVLPVETRHGTFVAPQAYEVSAFEMVDREIFGPILHVVRFEGRDLDGVIEAINRSGYGLTLGIHSRVGDTAEYLRSRARVGNIYVNRNMIGAVVGVQPFGGEGLSGTGPKAGGPHYVARFATERVFTVNTAAVGGNATLLALDERSSR